MTEMSSNGIPWSVRSFGDQTEPTSVHTDNTGSTKPEGKCE